MAIVRISLSCDSTANWEQANPVLLAGEPAVELTTQNKVLFKIGDGVTHWNDLAYQGGDMQAISNILSEYAEIIGKNSQDIQSLDTTVNGENGLVSVVSTLSSSIDTIVNSINSITYYRHNIVIQTNDAANATLYLTKISRSSTPFTQLTQIITEGETLSVTGVAESNYNVMYMTMENSVVSYVGTCNGVQYNGILSSNVEDTTISDSVSEIL